MSDARESVTAKKLAILLPHLIQHNVEHAEDLEKWIASANEDGCAGAAKEMGMAQALMNKISAHLTLALESIGGTSGHGRHHDHQHPHTH